MIIKADKDGLKAIEQLYDIALKTGGLQNMAGIQAILAGLSEIEDPFKKEE